MKQINLENVHACISEIQDCSRGLAYFDHLFGRVIDDLAERQEVWDAVESEAAMAARKDAPSAATAVEIKARITDYINKKPSARKARDELAEAQGRKVKIDRWCRSLEKRLSAAQSANNGHETIGRYGGGS